MAELPSGTVTFLFTDLESSTRLWEEHPEAMKGALARHDQMVRSAVETHGGYVVKARGDGFHAAFATAHDAIDAALEAQRVLSAERWDGIGPPRVRMGMHTGESQERAGDYFGSAVNRAARLVAVAHGGQIVCSRATVEVAGAHVTMRSLGEHRLRDLGASQELFQIGDGSFPPLQSVDAVPTNLPTVLTELIGRSGDVERITKLLDRERLVTLTGVGGVGKTRLALAVAGAAVDAFPDGVWFVELAPVTSADEVVRSAALAMGAPASDRTGLAQYLSNRRALVVLDNCEHVLGQAAGLAEAILSAGSETVIIATSREPLGVDGETVRGVPSLAVPDSDDEDDDVAAAAAVRLFVERASAATDAFELSEADLPMAVAICAQLDGIPLAIELAASRVRVMSLAEISSRLGERFRLLAGGRGAHERHRTLQATVAWSHDLLEEPERRVFRRLAAFPGSFDLDAADAVAGDAETYVLDALVRLIEQSLVQHDATTGRYRLLETLRQYAADRLTDAGETEWAIERHAEWYRSLAGQLASFGGFPTMTTIERFDIEMDNVQATADWLAAHERWVDLLRLARHLFGYGFLESPVQPRDWYRIALEHTPELDVQERIDALGELEYLLAAAGFPSDGASIALAERTGLLDSPTAWFARYLVALRRDDAVAITTSAERMLAVAEERSEELATLTGLGLVASVRAMNGDERESGKLAAEGLRRARLMPNTAAVLVMTTLVGGGYVGNIATPNFAAGLAFLEANPVDPKSGSRGSALWLHFEWGMALLGVGRVDRAVPYLTRAMRLADQSFPAAQMDIARAIAVAVGEAGDGALGVHLAGYARASFAGRVSAGASDVWLEPRLAAIEDGLDAAERGAALERGRHLDRRGFMHLLTDVERRFGEGAR